MRLTTRALLFLTVALAGTAGSALAQTQTKLLRFPDIHGDRVVFVYAGDLWTAPITGGAATRVTTHPGRELFPKFSPDGTKIAFTGQYDGDEQVYVVDAWGGVPKQLTYYPARGPFPDRWGTDNQVYGWTPDGTAILFRSMQQAMHQAETRLYTVPLTGGLPSVLPMKISGAGDFSPDGTKVAFSPLARDFRTWKRYSGGWAQDLYTFDLATGQSANFTSNVRTDRDPMWIGDRIYFSSDRSGTLNLFYFDVKTSQTQQVTQYTGFDLRWPSKGGDKIVFELGGELKVLDTNTQEIKDVPIFVPTDGLAMRPRHMDVSGYLEGFGLSPDGKRAVVVARGDVFSVPVEKGPVRNLTHSSGAHDKDASWSPDGRYIAYISDATGEEEFYLVDGLGQNPPRQLTQYGKAMRYRAAWSPDSKLLAFTDKDGKLYVVEAASGTVTQVADDMRGNLGDESWAPDSSHLAFSMSDINGFRSIHIWSVADKQLHRVTDETFNEFEPVWDPDGNYLFYLSDREFAPQISTVEWNFSLNRTTGIFALALRKDVPHLFAPQSDEVTVTEEAKPAPANAATDKPATEAAATDAAKDKKPLVIEYEGLAQRVMRVPVDSDNYRSLMAIKGKLIFVRGTPFFYGREAGQESEIKLFTFEDRSEETIVEGADGYTLSNNGEFLLTSVHGTLTRYETKAGGGDAKEVSLAELSADVVPKEEWVQVFHEVWRRYRDFFYVENLHGYDWAALRDQYRPLLDHAGHRSDVNYIIGEMISELNVGHAYNSGGDFEIPDRTPVGLPGALFELDPAVGRYKIVKIYGGNNEEPIYRSPLTEVGVNVQVGMFVLAIDGQDLVANDSPYRLLRNKAGHPVSLLVNDRPDREGAKTVVFNPIRDEQNLQYLEWVEGNRRRVAEMTGSRVGYLHIPDMSEDGIREFIKQYYPQIRKEGLVIDVRSNGGGNVSQMIIERLRRTLLATGYSRNSDVPETYPEATFHGNLVCLLDEDSASDGDIFPAMFRQAGLGPLIGKRSWGGVIGITNHGTLIDGGLVFVPEFGFSSTDGRWVIEGHGVDPDIVVENDPQSLLQGKDPQLERGVQEVLNLMNANPKRLPARPAPPIKTKDRGPE